MTTTERKYSIACIAAIISLAIVAALLFATLPCSVAIPGLALPAAMIGIILRVSSQQTRRQARHDAFLRTLEGK